MGQKWGKNASAKSATHAALDQLTAKAVTPLENYDSQEIQICHFKSHN
jgi:hypothetical protein